MAIRFPLTNVLSYSNTIVQGGGPTSVAGGVAKPFLIPQDTDNVVVKLTASVMSGGVSATFQTTDDGGTTWYDVARTSIVSNANTTTAEWLNISTTGPSFRTGVIVPSVVATGSVVSFGSVMGAPGSSAASSLGQKSYSGIPLMSPQARVFLMYSGTITSVLSEAVTVSVNSQSASA